MSKLPAVTCPVCLSEFCQLDSPEDYARVSAHLEQPRALAPAEPSQQEPSQEICQYENRPPEPAWAEVCEWVRAGDGVLPAPPWEEVCHWIRLGAPGRALEVAERAMQEPKTIPDTIGAAEEIIRAHLVSIPEFTARVFAELEAAIAKVDGARYSEPNAVIGPMSVSERETMAAAVLNVLFNTSL